MFMFARQLYLQIRVHELPLCKLASCMFVRTKLARDHVGSQMTSLLCFIVTSSCHVAYQCIQELLGAFYLGK